MIFEYFFKICHENSSFIKIAQVLYVKTNRHFWSYLTQFFLEWKMFQTKVVEKIKTNILRSITFFLIQSCHLWDVEKYFRAGQVADDSVAHVHCMLNTKGCIYTFRLCNTYFFSTATVVAWTHPSVMLYVHCLSCYYL